jgi:hypothetical protein
MRISSVLRNSLAVLLLLTVMVQPFTASSKEQIDDLTWEGKIGEIPTYITVIPRGHEVAPSIRTSKTWWEWGNTTTDVYLFAFYDRSDVRLILAFEKQADGLPVAKIYVNNLGSSRIDYSITASDVTIHSNSGYPYATIKPIGGSWIIEGKTNYNLEIAIDGITQSFGYSEAKTDGIVDVMTRVGSTDPGIPNWQTQHLVFDPHPEWGYARFLAIQRLPNSPPFKVAPPLMPMFPFFGMDAIVTDKFNELSESQYRSLSWFEENPHPLSFNTKSSVFSIYPFPGFQTGGMFAVYSLAPPPAVNFEAPFAFYNFNPDSRYSHLSIRSERFPAGDPSGYGRQTRERSTWRYSWKTTNDHMWQYALGFAGVHSSTQQVQIGDATLNIVGPEELPKWITQRAWPITTFIEATEGYPGSEGIYFYSAQSNDSWPWLDGEIVQQPRFLREPYISQTIVNDRYSFATLPKGFRSEYITPNDRTVKFYLSPIDDRLHMLYANGGVWNLGNQRILRTHNLVADAYIDGWTRETLQAEDTSIGQDSEANLEPSRAFPGIVEEALYALDNYLIYSGPKGSEIHRVSYKPEKLQIDPPTDRKSWLHFNNIMKPYENKGGNPFDLHSWLNNFSSTSKFSISGSISGIRATGDGFRFVIELHPGFKAEGDDIIGMRNLQPGEYVVRYDGQFSIEPLTAPQVSANMTASDARQFESTRLQIALNNAGLEDAPSSTLELWATSAGATPTLVTTQTVSLLAQTPITATLEWAPELPGQWSLTPKIVFQDGQLVELPSSNLVVHPAASATTQATLGLSVSPDSLALIVLVMLSFSALGALVFWQHARPQENKQVDNAE